MVGAQFHHVERTTVHSGGGIVPLAAVPDTGVWYCGERHDATATVDRGPLNVVELRTDHE